MLMNAKTRALGIVMVGGCVASLTSAQTPAALDLVSPETPIVVGVRNLGELSSDVQRWAKALLPAEATMQMAMMDQMLSLPGLNREGSAAVIVTLPKEGGMNPQPMPTMVLPVEDFGAFVEAMQGNPGDAVAALNIMGETAYAKDLPGGFIVMSPDMSAVENFAGTPGQNPAHEARMGKRGAGAASGTDLFVVVDMAAMRPMLNVGLAEMKAQMQFAAMMGGEAAAEQIDRMMRVAEAVVSDAKTAVLGVGLDERGVWLDFAGQFEEASDTGAIFAEGGDASKLLGAVPSMDYIFAMAYDSSSPGMRRLMAGAAEMNSGPSFTMKNSTEIAELTKGQAMVMGTTPGLFAGGLFTNTIVFTSCDEPGKIVEAMRKMMTEADGTSEDGMIFKTSYQEDAAEVAGRSLDAWSLQMEPDYNHENAMAAGMALSQFSMLFGGQSGPSGYIASSDAGVYTSFARNSRLMERVLGGGDSMAANAQIVAAAEHLPAERTAEFYLNIKGVLDMVAPMMAMMAPGADLGQIPEKLSPIAMGLATGEHGMHARLYVPADVIEFGASLGERFGGGGGWEDDMDEPDARPRF